jgi:Ca2+-binding RTX toxin-like protein
VAGIGTANASSALACGHDFFVGGATLYMDDPEAPSLGALSGPGRPVGNTPATITTSASDPGMGVSLVRAQAVRTDGQTEYWYVYPPGGGCSGLTESPCPSNWGSISVPYDPSVMPEGNRTLTVYAQDAVGHWSAAQNVTVTVDRIAPDTVIDSGPANNGSIAGATASFTYHSTEASSTFECKLDAAAYASCSSSGYTTPTLANGSHTVSIRAIDQAGNPDASAASRTFYVGPPDTVIDSGPSGLTNNNTPEFTYHATQPGATFSCSIDSGSYSSCATTGYTAPLLGDGSHTFNVKASSSSGVVDATPASRSFTVDATPPSIKITAGPSGPTQNTSATFEFAAEAGSTVKCSFDTGTAGFGACTTGTSHTVTKLAQATYTFRVRATDTAGNQATATRSITVDTTPPDTTIDAGPEGLTGNSTPGFAYSASESGSRFECRFDAEAFDFCPDDEIEPDEALADGAHTVYVRAVDAAGNVDGTPASRAFTVDSTKPSLKIESGPSGATNNSKPTFTFSASGGSTLSCALDADAAQLEDPGYGSCSGAGQHTPGTALAEGSYTFRVRATDAADNLSVASRRFTVDMTAPETTIESGPTGTTDDPQPTFDFSSNETRALFECRFDSEAFGLCSGLGRTHAPAEPLADGTHVFEVRATDPAGNVDATAAARSFTVDTKAPQTTITATPGSTTGSTSPTFEYSSSSGVTFECKLDAAAFAPCPAGTYSPSGLSEGEHSFAVRAVSGASNPDPTPAERNFIVDTSAPSTPVASGDLRNPGTPGVDLHVEIHDGNATAPSTIRSGVKTIRVFVDGQLTYADEMPCINRLQTCADTLTRDLELPYQRVLGSHTFKVEGTDALGHLSPPVEWVEFTPEEGTVEPRINPSAIRNCTEGATGAKVDYNAQAGVIRGSEGSDLIVSNANFDTIYAGGGCDVIIGGPRPEKIHGGGDDDLIRGGRSNDHIFADGGADQVYGGIGDDHIFGETGADRLDGGPGADQVRGQDGSDLLRGGQGQDELAGGAADTDTISYADAVMPGYSPSSTGVSGVAHFPDGDPGVYIDMRNNKAVGDDGPEGRGGGVDYLYIPKGTAKPGNADVEEAGSFEKIVGSAFTDVIRASNQIQKIEAGPGSDVVYGGGAAVVEGGLDGDYLNGGGSGSLIGGDGEIDRCVAGSTTSACGSSEEGIQPRNKGVVTLGVQRPGAGGSEVDVFVAGSELEDKVTVEYHPQANLVQFIVGPETVGRVSLQGCGRTNNTVNCRLGGGKDMGALVVSGGKKTDYLTMTQLHPRWSGAIELNGGPGRDDVGGNELEELLLDGTDQVNGSEGSGSEQIHSGSGDDALVQGDGADHLDGGGDNDLLLSSDICENDNIQGGGGRDNAQFHAVDIGVFASIAEGKIGHPTTSGNQCPGGGFDSLGGVDDLEGSPQRDVFKGDGGANLLIGRGGHDSLSGFDGPDVLNSRDGHKSDDNVNCGDGGNDLAHVDLPEDKPAIAKCEDVDQEGEAFPDYQQTANANSLSAAIAASSTDLSAPTPPQTAPMLTAEFPLNDSEGTEAENLVEGGEAGTYEAAGVGPATNDPGPSLEAPGALRDNGEDPGVELDGAEDFIDLEGEGEVTEVEEAEEEIASGYSVELWVQFDSQPEEREYLFSSLDEGEGAYLFRGPDGKIVFGTNTEAGDPQVLTAEPVEDEDWHHVVGTLEDEEIVLYVDGFPNRLGYGQEVLPEEVESEETLVGVSPGMDYFLDGSIDEVSTYDGALSEGEVIEHLAVSKAEEAETLLAPEPETSDVDGDGVFDGVDNCAQTANAGQVDEDANGIGDACAPPDGDGDEVADANDNCLDFYNPDQADANADGLGDACSELPPGATTEAASEVKGATATLNAKVDPVAQATTYQFEYGKTESYGSKVPLFPKSAGSGIAPVAASTSASGLEPNTTYHYRVVATNAAGTTEGADQTFTTQKLPVVTTGAASEVKTTSASLAGTVNPEGLEATYQIEYGKTIFYGSKAPASPGAVGAGTSPVAVGTTVTGLEANTTYHYRVAGTSAAGTARGEDKTFKTEPLPATPGQLAGMAVTEPFDGSAGSVANFGSKWSALGWAGGTKKGEDTAAGWRPIDAFSTVNGAYYNPVVTDTGSGAAASVTMATNPSITERYFSLWLDMAAPSAASREGYEVRFLNTATNTYTVTLSKWKAGTQTTLATQTGFTFVEGNSFAVADEGSNVSAWVNTGSGFVQLLSAADATFAGGNAGIEGSGNITRLINFKVGALLSPVANMDAALKALPVRDTFATSESPLSGGGAWSALSWDNSTSGHNTGYVSGGWGPWDAFSTVNGAYWQKATFADTGAGAAVRATLQGNPTITERYFSLWLDMPAPNSAKTGYELRFTETASTVYEAKLSKWQAGTKTTLAAKTGYSFPNGSQFALVEKGGTVSAWTMTGTEFTQLLSAADSALSDGYTGIEAAGNITRLVNFSGGPLPPF